MNVLKNIGPTLKKVRESKNLSISEVADKIEYEPYFIDIIEGKGFVDLYELHYFCSFYEIKLSDFFKMVEDSL